jgi:hypothetical protein
MKRFITILSFTVLTAALAFAGGGQQGGGSAASGPRGKSSKAEKDWRIALVPKDSPNARFVRMEVGV